MVQIRAAQDGKSTAQRKAARHGAALIHRHAQGGILQHPVTSKSLRRDGDENYFVGAAEMHGFRATMEDAMTIRLQLSQKHPNISMFGVYDGHRGSRCSRYLQEHLPARVGALEDPHEKGQLGAVMTEFDKQFLKNKELRLDGSTCVFALCQPLASVKDTKRRYRVTVCNVGDSRAVLIRAGTGAIVALTRDHKPEDAGERQRIYGAGGLVRNNRVDGQLALSRAFGDWNYKCQSHLPYHKQKVIAIPDVTNEIMYEGDILLVCCDGLFEQLSRQEVAAFVYKKMRGDCATDPAKAVVALLDHVLDQGSKDNMSCICICMRNGKQFAGRKAEFLPGRFHEYKADKDFVRAYLADAKRSGFSRQKLMTIVPPPDAAAIDRPAFVGVRKRRSPRRFVALVVGTTLALFLLPEQRPLVFFAFSIFAFVLARNPRML